MAYHRFDRGQWEKQLQQAKAEQPLVLQAIEYRRQWRTKSQPFLLECDDGLDYVVKAFGYGGRQLINDQLVARLGILLEAPVGKPQLINIVAELIEIEPYLRGVAPGIAHGCQWIPDCRDEWTLIATSEPENRLRLVLLATLYGWTIANDHQFLFNKYPPRLIHSVDHGHFFPNPPNWSVNDLANVSQAELDAFFADCNFMPEELGQAGNRLRAITIDDIIATVAVVPEDWGFTMEEQLAMVGFLVKRQQEILEGLLLASSS